jgi:hypothetical protein
MMRYPVLLADNEATKNTMRNHLYALIILILIYVFLVGCGPNPEALATRLAVTLTALPTTPPYPTLTPNPTGTPAPTQTPNPTYTVLPTSTTIPTYTPFPIANLYCNYGFCISMPPDIYFITDNPERKNDENSGGLLAANSSISQEVWWKRQLEYDWNAEQAIQSMLDKMAEAEEEPIQPKMDEIQTMKIGELEVTYQSGKDTNQKERPYLVLSTWYCGQHTFTSAIWADEDTAALDLLRQALGQFRCDQ